MDSNKNLSSANFSAIYPMFLKHEDYSANTLHIRLEKVGNGRIFIAFSLLIELLCA